MDILVNQELAKIKKLISRNAFHTEDVFKIFWKNASEQERNEIRSIIHSSLKRWETTRHQIKDGTRTRTDHFI